VDFALCGLLQLVGSDTRLQLEGKNGCVLTKIFGHKDLAKGASLDDLKQNNTRRVVAKFEMTPEEGEESAEIITYKLTFRPAHDPSQLTVIDGSIVINFTSDPSVVDDNKNEEVLVAVGVQEAGELDSQVAQLMDEGKRDEVIALQNQQVACYSKLASLDKDKKYGVSNLLTQVQGDLESIKKEGLSKKMKKKAHHRGYMNRRNSIGYCNAYDV